LEKQRFDKKEDCVVWIVGGGELSFSREEVKTNHVKNRGSFGHILSNK